MPPELADINSILIHSQQYKGLNTHFVLVAHQWKHPETAYESVHLPSAKKQKGPPRKTHALLDILTIK